MQKLLSTLINNTRETGNNYKPHFYRLADKSDRQLFNKLLTENHKLQVFDEIEGQLGELIKSLNPRSKFNEQNLSEQIARHISNEPIEEYGVWIYYPWSFRVVHILDEEEFKELRTSRNQYKITRAERDELATKKVGVVGLSVGQSVAVTMAMERCFGEIRLADFDVLELSNLNRIRTGLYNLGISKVISVAREIAELDPFLKVKCYTDGLTENNIEQFLTEGGKLNMLIDECDSIDMKVMCRLKCREHAIPLVMEASDRGCIDIERYDLEPERPIFHGYLDHLNTSKMKGLTNEEKIPYLISIHPPDSLSKRIKASMMEVDETITTWPQLASAVTLGGALATDVCRRVMLGRFNASGRYFVDLEELINDEGVELKLKSETLTEHTIDVNEMRSIVNNLKDTLDWKCKSIDKALVEELVAAAISAPTGGNSQPWKWFYSDGLLALFLDKSRSNSYMDYKDIASYIGLGAAIENLVLKAVSLNQATQVKLFPFQNEKELVAVIGFMQGEVTNEHLLLAEVINLRCTNRIISERKPLESEVLTSLQNIVSAHKGAKLQFIDEVEKIEGIAEIVGGAERIRMLNPKSHHDFFVNELRWNTEQSKRTNDGVDLMTMNLTSGQQSGLQIAKDPEVMTLLKDWNIGGGLLRIRRNIVNAASAIGLITLDKQDSRGFVAGGRLVERVWLAATQKGIAFQPLFVPLMFFQRLKDNDIDLPEDLKKEVVKLKDEFLNYFPDVDKREAIMLFRLCVADAPEVKSLRRPVNEVLYY